MRTALRKAWWWLTGMSRCLENCPHNSGAFCKRRSGHWGNHRTSSGFSWTS
jgi:hypothetical protein